MDKMNILNEILEKDNATVLAQYTDDFSVERVKRFTTDSLKDLQFILIASHCPNCLDALYTKCAAVDEHTFVFDGLLFTPFGYAVYLQQIECVKVVFPVFSKFFHSHFRCSSSTRRRVTSTLACLCPMASTMSCHRSRWPS